MAALPAMEPQFIDVGGDGLASLSGGSPQRFAIHHPPHGGSARGLVVQVHAFGEEMNKSRRMAALQSRAFAALGLAVLQFDLLGCGDSDGDFGDASWARWVDDTVAAARWLMRRHPQTAGSPGLPLWLWGHRAGALVAAEAATRLDGPVNFLFWQPTVAGTSVVHQQLRLKAAGDLMSGQAKTAVAAARADLAAGRAVEVAGYTLQPGLCAGLEAATLHLPPALPGGLQQVVCIELAAAADGTLSLPVQRQAEMWRAAGWMVQAQVATGPAFWQTLEIAEAPALLAASSGALERALTSVAKAHAAAATPQPACAAQAGAMAAERATAVLFDCGGDALVGVLHPASHAAAVGRATTGDVVVVGGPQYRAGSHRQFVGVARAMATAGVNVLRFDVRGMGDSSGEPRSFEALADDIGAAIDALQRTAGVKQVVLWGLCDGASAALLYLHDKDDPRVCGLVLANPWVRSPQTQALAQVKHYYPRRVLQGAFWGKLLRGAVSLRAVGELLGAMRRARRASPAPAAADGVAFQERMLEGLTRRQRPALLLLSGDDYTAREFSEQAAADARWQRALSRKDTVRHDLALADHTFSSVEAGTAVARLSAQWVAATAGTAARLSPLETMPG